MKIYPRLIYCVAPLVLLCGCKKSGTEQSSEAKPAPSQSAAPAASTPASAPAAAAGTADADKAAEASAKMSAAEWAMKQDEIKHDPNGEWAIQATASSTYNDAQGTASYSANQATGVPNVDRYADDGNAWAPKTEDGGIEWLDLKYPKPVHATEVRVRIL